MAKFDLIRDEKIETWIRYYVPIEAENIEEAAKKLLAMDDFEADDHEELLDSAQTLTPEENHGFATIEIFDPSKDNFLICNNSVNKIDQVKL